MKMTISMIEKRGQAMKEMMVVNHQTYTTQSYIKVWDSEENSTPNYFNDRLNDLGVSLVHPIGNWLIMGSSNSSWS